MFVMDIYHQPAQARDEALYHYAVMLVETVQEKLKAAKEHDDFINHVIYAQCAMMDDAVLNTASSLENSVWLHNPLQARFVMQMASLMCRQITVAETDCNERFNAERLRQRMRYL